MKTRHEPLGRWQEALSGVAPDLIAAIEPWLGRLAHFAGPYSLATTAVAGEPQGYSGLAASGSYSRLLASEWALLRAAPLEFQRRALAGEQLFFALAREQPAGSRRCLALADAGPHQLGNCRLAQMALLVALAERARAAGARFLWSSWQSAPGDLAEGFDGSSLRRFLEQRSHLPVDEARAAAWLAELGLAEGEEVWSLGEPLPASKARSLGAVRQVLIAEDESEIHARALCLRWQPRGRPPQELRLELPSEAERMWLLGNPYQRELPSSRLTGGPIESAHFSDRAERLVVKAPDGLKVFYLPADFRARVSAPRSFRQLEEEELVAAGAQGGRLLVVVKKGSHLLFHRVGKGADRERAPVAVAAVSSQEPSGEKRLAAAPAPGSGCGPCLPDLSPGRKFWFFRDGDGVFHGFDFQSRTLVHWPGILSLHVVGNRTYSLLGGGHRNGKSGVCLWQPDRGWELRRFSEADRPSDLAFAARVSKRNGGAMPVAWSLGANLWQVGDRILEAGEGQRVVGLAGGLVAIDRDGRSLVSIGSEGSRVLVRAESPIRGVAVAAERPLLAFWTAGGGLQVISLVTLLQSLRLVDEARP